MPTDTLTLVSDPLCPFVQRVAIVLHEKRVPFELVHIDVSNKPAWFSEISPAGKVPLLRIMTGDGTDAILFESLAICEYLDESVEADRLHPADALSRARHRAWMEQCSGSLGDAWKVLLAKDPAAHEKALTGLRGKLEALESALDAGPYFAGSAFCMVDAVMAPVFRYFDVLADRDVEEMIGTMPGVSRWRRALADRPSVKAAVKSDYPERLRSYIARLRAI